MRIHLRHRPEEAAERALVEGLSAEVALGFGALPEAPDFEVLVDGEADAVWLAASPRLGALVIPWAGIPAPVARALEARPALAVYNLHHNASATAEMAMTLLLAAAKSILPADRALRTGDWSHRGRNELAVGLDGRTALVLGVGEVGTRVALACRGMGMRVRGISRTGRPVAAVEVGTGDRLHEWLPEADALVVCVPATSRTIGMIGPAELALLPSRAVVVNVARGSVIDERALYDALARRAIFAAGLDVWWCYPRGGEPGPVLPASAPFEALPNVVMSPHRGGHVQETEVLRMRALAGLLSALAAGTPPRAVDVGQGY